MFKQWISQKYLQPSELQGKLWATTPVCSYLFRSAHVLVQNAIKYSVHIKNAEKEYLDTENAILVMDVHASIFFFSNQLSNVNSQQTILVICFRSGNIYCWFSLSVQTNEMQEEMIPHSLFITAAWNHPLSFVWVSSYKRPWFVSKHKAFLELCSVTYGNVEKHVFVLYFLNRFYLWSWMDSLLFTAHVHMNCPTLPHFICFSTSLNHFLPEKGLFILESEPLKQCISVNRSKLVLEDCERPTRRMLWKWVSQHRLFNLGTSACLGLNISNSTQPLGMFECDVSLPVLWWRCSGNTLYGASQWRVTVVRGLVVVKKNIYHQWKRYNTPREGPCSYPYEGKQPRTSCVPCLHKIFLTSSETRHVLFIDIHTLLGNAHGMPCAFPFKYNNQWYSECTTEGREDHLLWCSTTPRYDKGERWGFCPVQGKADTQTHPCKTGRQVITGRCCCVLMLSSSRLVTHFTFVLISFHLSVFS